MCLKLNSIIVFLVTCFAFKPAYSQSVTIKGSVLVKEGSVENIYVLNTTSKRFTLTDNLGNFKIPVKLNDVISFSFISYKPYSIVVDKQIINKKQLSVILEEEVDKLEEVVVSSMTLTGDLAKDLKKLDEPVLDFEKINFPRGYKGVLATVKERKLYEATHEFGMLPFNKIVNGISGRTKKLKEYVRLEKNTELMKQLKKEIIPDFFKAHKLEEKHKEEFLFFCEEASGFYETCRKKKRDVVIVFLEEKLIEYKKNLESK